MFTAPDHKYLISEDLDDFTDRLETIPNELPKKKKSKEKLEDLVEQIEDLQQILYADNRYSVLAVFQALDAAGKDSTIRGVFRGVNPAGCQVFSFKQPSAEELDHDFLWRTSRSLPERGRIGVFNRSYYEEVLVVRVQQHFLQTQRLPEDRITDAIWQERFESICAFEEHLARNGTIILKFWLNVSKEEQLQRFLSRLENPAKHWKFSEGDLKVRERWDEYIAAYHDVLRNTSRPWAPWYAIPADDKSFMRATIAEIVVDALSALPIRYPEIDKETEKRFAKLEKLLREEAN